MTLNEYKSLDSDFYSDERRADCRLSGLMGLLANAEWLIAAQAGKEQDFFGVEFLPRRDTLHLLRCVSDAKREVLRLYGGEEPSAFEAGGEMAALNEIEEMLLQYEADGFRLGFYPPLWAQ